LLLGSEVRDVAIELTTEFVLLARGEDDFHSVTE
jgi:hypothetical protein